MLRLLKKLDLTLTIVVFVFTLILTGVSIWYGLDFDSRRISNTKQYAPVVKAEPSTKVVKIFEDKFIKVESKHPIVVTRIKPDSYKITLNSDTIQVFPIKLTDQNDYLKYTGKHSSRDILYRMFNGIMYAGFSSQHEGEAVYFVQKGFILFKIVDPGVLLGELERILGSLSFKAPGTYASLNFIDDKNDSILVEINNQETITTENFEGFEFNDGRLETNMFSMNVPRGWEIYNTSECIVMFDANKQSEQFAIFTLKSVKFTQKKYEAFLDQVYGGHEKPSSLKLGKLDFIYSSVDGGSTQYQTLLHPINQIFGLMIQSRSIERRISKTQQDMIASIILK